MDLFYFYFLAILLLISVESFRATIHSNKHRNPITFFTTAKSQNSHLLASQNTQSSTPRRRARRLNHVFRYLYRHDHPHNLTTDSTQLFLQLGYNATTISQMNESFPVLLKLNVKRQLYPMVQFLQQTMNISELNTMPPYIWGARLEGILAPRHAFLEYAGLAPNWNQYPQKLLQCLQAGRKPHTFAQLCREWHVGAANGPPNNTSKQDHPDVIPSYLSTTAVHEFDTLFGRGLMAAARNDVNNTHLNVSSADLTRLLIQHGANPHQQDHRGVSLLHWAAGVGSLSNVQVLQEYVPLTLCTTDGATVLHWAAAGVTARQFGTGGHEHICVYLLKQIDNPTFVNQQTAAGNSAVMWAAWSGSLSMVKLLISHGASLEGANFNGCTIAHWAASGGNLEICQYLADVGVDFRQTNRGGNTPLTHAVAFGHANIVEWLQDEIYDDSTEDARALAQNFVDWTGGDCQRRKKVLKLFEALEEYDYG